MLRITPKATDHLLRVRGEKGLDANSVPRLIRRDGRLVLTWASGPESGDRAVDGGRVTTLVAPTAADLLEDSTIDVTAEDGRSVLVVARRRGGSGKATGRGTPVDTRSRAGATS
jgi:Fe-S cluster assembly iron-binding protein IscA